MNSSLDKPVFGLCAACGIVVSVSILVSPADAGEVLNDIYLWIAHEIGLLYQWAVILSFVFLVWLGCSRFGKQVLGDEGIGYPTASWVGMLFCSGVGAGLVYWTTIERGYYLKQPPFGVAPHSDEALEWAATYGIFHWSLPVWSLYALAVVAITYPNYKYKLKYLRLSGSLVGLFGSEFIESKSGRFVDLIFILAMVGGTGTSLG